VAFHLLDVNAQLDASWRVMAGGDGEMNARAVEYAGRNRHAKLVMKELRAVTGAARAPLGPRLAASAAVMAGAPYGNFERNDHASGRVAGRKTDRCVECRRALASKEGAPDAIDRGRHRRKIDDDLVGKAAHLLVTVFASDDRNLRSAEGVKRVSAHELLVP
jgi:hypothetical protein